MSVAASSVTGFKGTLIRREHLAGKRCVKLVFSTADGARLSLTRNYRLAFSLKVGRRYRVSGRQVKIGEKLCLADPKIVTLGLRRIIRPYKQTVALVLAAVVVGTAYGLYSVMTESPNASRATAQQNLTQTQDSAPDPALPEATLGTSTPDPATTPAPTSVTTTPRRQSNGSTSNATAASTPQVPAATTSPTPQAGAATPTPTPTTPVAPADPVVLPADPVTSPDPPAETGHVL